MKANDLFKEIRQGMHDASDSKFVILPKQEVLDLLKELHGRRKRDSRPRK